MTKFQDNVWKMRPIKDVADVVSGATPRRDEPAYWGGTIPWITPKELSGLDDPIITGTEEQITEAGYRSASCQMLPVGTVLLSSRAPIGHMAVTAQRLCTNQGFKSLVPKAGIHSKFLYWSLRSRKEQLVALGRGATFKEVSKAIVEDFELPFPGDEREQERIATILDKADLIRRKRQQALRLTDDFLRSVFLEMFGNYLDAKDSDRFAGVLAMPLNNGFFAKNDQYGSGTPVIWVDDLYHTSLINTTSLRRAELTPGDLRKYAVQQGDLLFTRSSLVREGIGQCNVVPELDEPMAFECHIIRARIDHNKAHPRFIQGLFRSEFGKLQILRRANTATMTTISQGALEDLPCPLPPLPLQNHYAEIVKATEKVVASITGALPSTNQLFSALQQRAFSGQL